MSQMGKFISAASIGAIESVTGNVGGAVNPDGLGNLDLLGADPIVVTGTPASNLLTISVLDATTSQKGVVELATDAESIAGADTTRPIVPSSLEAKLGALTVNTIPYGAGTGAALSWTGAGTDGQLLIAATAGAPAFASLSSSGGFITFTPGANTLDLNTAGAVAVSFDADGATTATPALGVLTLSGGNNITTTAAGSTVTFDLTGTAQYAIQVGNATGSLDSLAIGSANQILQSGGAGANPAWSTATYPATTSQGDILYSSADNTLTSLAKDATATRYLANTGASNNPAWDQVNLTNGITGTLPVANGGTGVASVTAHALVVGDGTNAINEIAVGTDNTVLLGNTGADPTWGSVPNAALANSSITVNGGNNITVTGGTVSLGGSVTSIDITGTTQYAVQVGDATGSLDSLAVGANGEVLKGNTGANPSWGAVDLTTDVTGTLPVGNGGSGAATFTDHGVLLGSGAAAFTATAVGATGEVLKGVTGADPAFGAVDLTTDVTGTLPVGNGGTGVADPTDHSLLVGSGAGAMTELGVASNGQIPIGSTGADPVLATLTEGANITITNGAGSITIAASGGGGGGITWNEVTGTSQAAAVDNGYICNNAGLVTVTLPSTIAVGESVAITGKGAGKFAIAQNAGQTIYFGSTATTTGAGGSLTSDIQYGAIEILCITADTDFIVRSSVGNFTVV